MTRYTLVLAPDGRLVPVPPDFDPVGPERRALLAAVASCPDRGPSLPVSLQPECRCAELYACRAGRGAVPGRVTTADCLECRAATQPSPAVPT